MASVEDLLQIPEDLRQQVSIAFNILQARVAFGLFKGKGTRALLDECIGQHVQISRSRCQLHCIFYKQLFRMKSVICSLPVFTVWVCILLAKENW